MNSHETLTLLNQLSVYNRSKILIIDTIGNIFNEQHEFHQIINQHKENWLSGNLLVLTTLTPKLKSFSNATSTTKWNNIDGKMGNESTSTAIRLTESVTVNDDERTVINLLEIRLNANGQHDAYKTHNHDNDSNNNNDNNILVHFNETELNLIASVFEKLYNDSCRTVTEKIVSNISHSVHNKTNTFGKLRNGSRADGLSESLSMCASNNNILSKCKMVLREKTTLFANRTRTMDIIKVCEQIFVWRLRNLQTTQQHQQQQHQQQQQQQEQQQDRRQNQDNKSKSAPNILNRNVNNLGMNRIATAESSQTATTAKRISVTSSDFINFIQTQHDSAKFSEYIPFFDFIITKLALSHNLIVNYNMENGSQMDDSNGTVFGSTDDLCVLELNLRQSSLMDNIGNGNSTDIHLNQTFVWRRILTLRQNELNSNFSITPMRDHDSILFFEKFRTCGLLCWVLAGIILLLLICIIVASITFGLAIR